VAPMKLRSILAPVLLAVMVVVGALAASAAEVSESKARQIFESSGCTACHNGQIAPTFDGVVKKIREWAAKYPSIDDAVRAEYKYMGGAKSYDEMMQQMKRFTPQIKEEDYKLLYNFFKQVFEAAKGGGKTASPTTTATTTTTTTTTTITTTTPPIPVISLPPEATTTTTPPVTVQPSTTLNPYSAEFYSALNSGVLAAVAILAIAVAAAIIVYYRR